MPQVVRQEVTSKDGEVTVRLEITLNLNATGMIPPPLIQPLPTKIAPKTVDYVIPDFEEGGETIAFGK